MSKYPNLSASDPFVVETLRAMQIDSLVKQAQNNYTSNTTLASDSELVAPLAVGTYEIDFTIYASGNGGGLKTAWTFSGTASGNKACVGPGSANTGSASNTNSLYNVVLSSTTAISYTFTTGVYRIFEESTLYTVTAAGNLGIQFAQAVSNATSSTVNVASRLRWRQIA